MNRINKVLRYILDVAVCIIIIIINLLMYLNPAIDIIPGVSNNLWYLQQEINSAHNLMNLWLSESLLVINTI